MGGAVTLRSAVERGTTVRVELELPVGAADEAEPGVGDGRLAFSGRRALPSRETAMREGSLLLLVEDNPVNRQVLAGQLEAIGFRVDVAADADEALALFAAGDYGLVLHRHPAAARRRVRAGPAAACRRARPPARRGSRCWP